MKTIHLGQTVACLRSAGRESVAPIRAALHRKAMALGLKQHNHHSAALPPDPQPSSATNFRGVLDWIEAVEDPDKLVAPPAGADGADHHQHQQRVTHHRGALQSLGSLWATVLTLYPFSSEELAAMVPATAAVPAPAAAAPASPPVVASHVPVTAPAAPVTAPAPVAADIVATLTPGEQIPKSS